MRLKTSGVQEALVYAEARTPYEVYERLPALDKRIALRWVLPGAGPGCVRRSLLLRGRVLMWIPV